MKLFIYLFYVRSLIKLVSQFWREPWQMLSSVSNGGKSLSARFSFSWYLLHHSFFALFLTHSMFVIFVSSSVSFSSHTVQVSYVLNMGLERAKLDQSLSWMRLLIKKITIRISAGFPASFIPTFDFYSITASAFIFPSAISILCSFFAPLYFVILIFPFRSLPSCVYSKKAKGQRKVKVRKKQNSLI